MSHLVRPGTLLAAFLLAASAAVAQQAPAPAPSAAPAASASHLAVAREVAVESGITRSFDVVAPQLYDRLRQQAVTRPELSKDLNEVLEALLPEMELQKQRMVAAAAGIYARLMSEAELQATIAFFRSPAGRKYVESQPLILDDLVREMEKWSQDLAEYMMVRVRAEMGKRGHQMQ